MTACFLYNQCNHKDCDSEFCMRKYKEEALFSYSLLSEQDRVKKTLNIDADGTDLGEFKLLASMEQNIKDFVQQGEQLYLHSNICGNGKTSWAIRFIQAYIDRIWPTADLSCHVLFVNVPRFLLALKENISSPNEYASYIKANIYKADLVVWDDIAAKIGTEYELNNLLGFIDGRINLGKANIFTSNLSAIEMSAALGERLASRICRFSTDICLKGTDKRVWHSNTQK